MIGMPWLRTPLPGHFSFSKFRSDMSDPMPGISGQPPHGRKTIGSGLFMTSESPFSPQLFVLHAPSG
jgi:hypothetical protein